MSSHDIGRGRGGTESALSTVTAKALVLGIDSDRLFPIENQIDIARLVPGNIDGTEAVQISSEFGHDSFLIEDVLVGSHLARLLAT